MPADGYPWPFWGGRLVPGVELAEARLPDASREPLATQVGGFLRALHDPQVAHDLGGTLPHDPMRRGTPSTRGPMAREALDRLAARGTWDAASDLDRQIDDVIAAADPLPAPTGEPVLVHGDLHLRHLLVGADGRATGVIDWGDCCLADPALDLSLAYGAFSGPARAALLSAYGRPVDEERELRARLLALVAVRGAGRLRRHRGVPGAAHRVARRTPPRGVLSVEAQATSTGASSPRSWEANWVR